LYFAKLDNRSLIEISGEEAETFLDNLITCKVVGLETNHASFGALLTPQGKIMFDFFLIKTEDGYLIDTAEALAEELTKRLTFYRLRAKVDIAVRENAEITAVWGDDLTDRFNYIADPRHTGLGKRIYENQSIDGEQADYHAHRISLGIPEGGKDFEYSDAYPHETLMDQFAGVDFKKGCYVGQEVVSRMQHRGTAKKRVVHVSSEVSLPASCTSITADGKPAGTLGSIHGNSGLALVRLDRVAKAKTLEADGIPLTPRIQDWVSFSFPEAS